MAKFELKGLDKLYNKVETMSSAPGRSSKAYIEHAANVILAQQKEDASNLFNGTGAGAAALKITATRSGETYTFMDIGISHDNWYECRGLYFQHYGFKSKSATLWLTKAFKKSKSKVSKDIKESLKKGMGL